MNRETIRTDTPTHRPGAATAETLTIAAAVIPIGVAAVVTVFGAARSATIGATMSIGEIGDGVHSVMLAASAVAFSAITLVRALRMPARTSVCFVLLMVALVCAPMWRLLGVVTGSDVLWPEIVLYSCSAALMYRSRHVWHFVIPVSSIPENRLWRKRAAVAVGLIGGVALTHATQLWPGLNAYPAGSVEVTEMRVADMKRGEFPTLLVSGVIHSKPLWARVSVDIYPVGGSAPAYSFTQESRDPGTMVGRLDPGIVEQREFALGRPWLDAAPGTYYAIWSREETEGNGRRVLYRPLKTPNFQVVPHDR